MYMIDVLNIAASIAVSVVTAVSIVLAVRDSYHHDERMVKLIHELVSEEIRTTQADDKAAENAAK